MEGQHATCRGNMQHVGATCNMEGQHGGAKAARSMIIELSKRVVVV